MNKLRPTKFDSYLGQTQAKKNLEVCVKQSKFSYSPLDHILLCGPPGTGKTSLARVIAAEKGMKIAVELMGPRIRSLSDLDFLRNLPSDSIVFIDEVHALPTRIEEALYEAMEDYTWQGHKICGGFTLIGATTKEGLLSKPLHDRFTIIETLDLYTPEELFSILTRSATLMELNLNEDAAKVIAERSRGTPRLANQFLKRISYYAKEGGISKDIAESALNNIGIDAFGLDKVDREILRVMRDTFEGGPVGVEALASTLGEDPATIGLLREPYLLKTGFISRGPRGRSLTKKGEEYVAKQVVVA